ncbi:hypothetical protein FRC12_007428 [Ceratobasidium sp. 428]|nr:hypothetical protein FRC12_007428 [Ceratobasidium sp. 428]
MAKTVAFAALDRTASAIENPRLFREFYQIFTRLACFTVNNTTGEADMSLLTKMLWDSRDSFLTLCSYGVLPGCALLLLAIAMLLPSGPQGDRDILFLRDLSLRLYLVGSRRDQQILPSVSKLADRTSMDSALANLKRFVSPEDSHAIARAYSGLLLLWRQDNSSAKSVSIHFMSGVSTFVMQMQGRDAPTTIQEMMDVLNISLQFLWLFLEQKVRLSEDDDFGMIRYATLIFMHLRFILIDCALTQDEEYRFAQLIADNEIINLAGRVMLSAIVRECGFQKKDSKWLHLTSEQLVGLKDVFAVATSLAPELFHDARTEWSKVIIALAHASTVDLTESKQSGLGHYVLSMLKTWHEYGECFLSRSMFVPPVLQPSYTKGGAETSIRVRKV